MFVEGNRDNFLRHIKSAKLLGVSYKVVRRRERGGQDRGRYSTEPENMKNTEKRRERDREKEKKERQTETEREYAMKGSSNK